MRYSRECREMVDLNMVPLLDEFITLSEYETLNNVRKVNDDFWIGKLKAPFEE